MVCKGVSPALACADVLTLIRYRVDGRTTRGEPNCEGREIENQLLLRLALALAIGLLVGIERGWRQRTLREGARTAGVRTYALIGLLGGACGALSLAAGTPLPWVVTLAVLTLVFGVFALREGRAERNFSVTGVIAAMTVFVLGVLAGEGQLQAAAVAGVLTAGLLASRQQLHRAVAKLSWVELRSALLLLIMTVVVLPLLPDRAIDPLGAFNPHEIWLLMVLVAAVSYTGYIALRVAGPARGPLVAGLAGGLTSSTATTIALARRSREVEQGDALAEGVALAAMVSLGRTYLLALAVQPALAGGLAPAIAAAAVVFGLAGVVALLHDGRAKRGGDIGVPFELITVLGFGALLAVIVLAGAWVTDRFGAGGTYLFAAISGFVDVDAVTLASARSVGRGATADLAATAILTALGSNAVLRAVYGWTFGSRSFAGRLTLISALALAAGGLAWAVSASLLAAG